MINARQELEYQIGGRTLICASIRIWDEHIILKKDYTSDELETFLSQLDDTYDNGYGSQELEGIVLCEDGVWLTRGEYDGSEWWETHRYPQIPKECIV